ncbi:hypothetical protein ACGFN1_32130 [Streptomyces sp. NPDC048685]|uniref:hypothetical protein n=1 Tax=Streptomyces sp. NPDC048685 TaxID=3365584 RepID=UPI003713AB74
MRLVLIDETHRLNSRTTSGAETADLLEDLTERLPATLVHTGINVTDTPLFTGTRGAQLAGRATRITCGPPSPPTTAPSTPPPSGNDIDGVTHVHVGIQTGRADSPPPGPPAACVRVIPWASSMCPPARGRYL